MKKFFLPCFHLFSNVTQLEFLGHEQKSPNKQISSKKVIKFMWTIIYEFFKNCFNHNFQLAFKIISGCISMGGHMLSYKIMFLRIQ